MRKYLSASLFATTLWSGLSLAEPTYIEKMTGLPAICSLDAMHEETKVWAAAKKYGEGSKRWSEAFHHRLDVVRLCVDDAKSKGKALYRAETDRLPQLKSELADMYVSWLGYLDHLIDDDRDAYERQYEFSANRLKAQVDSM
ncbi:hypothetical protein CMV24_29445 [Pseudomonas plecoglossicida]|uniref:DUF1311 domain-containing protein n=1 Tax=Pseudomonas plecoglossicida TaxID=70775 RepID=A0A2A3LWT6_PSEDL|nr:hypothetical protein [Pseudomonas plecoglossicida]PBJ91991.1 hypothetical protein CMV24_29445 [Pseudomonas plecoglossicida]